MNSLSNTDKPTECDCGEKLLICDSGMRLCSVGCKDKWVNSRGEILPTIDVSYNFKFMDCNGKCESSPKIGKSWWKQFGYNSPCMCLKNLVILNSMDSCSCCFKLLDYNINDDIQGVGEKSVCGDCYEKYYDY